MPKNIDQVIKTLKNNGVVIYPTDTAYAIGCKFKSKKGIAKILKFKKRRDTKFTLIASSLYQVEKYFKLNSCQKKIAKKYWPGPVSIVVSKNFAIRVPANKIARNLARAAGQPLIATSFNISGQSAIYNLNVRTTLGLSRHDILIINAGPLTKRKSSAILQCSQNKIKTLRHGPFAIKISS